MGSFARKLRKAVSVAVSAPEDDDDTGHLLGMLALAGDVAGWVRKAAKTAGRPTVEMAVGLVHKSNKAWLSHLGQVNEWPPVDAYLLTPVFRRTELGQVHPQAESLLKSAHRDAMRGKPTTATLALVIGEGGRMRAFPFQLAADDSAPRAAETYADNHMGFDDLAVSATGCRWGRGSRRRPETRATCPPW